MQGWIKLHRKIQDSFFYTDSQAVHLWLHILLKANHKTNKFMWNGEEIEVLQGQFITGRKKLSIETGVNESKVQRLLKMFIKSGNIEQLTNRRHSMITVLKWGLYQVSEQPMNNQRTTSEQPVITNKNVNNEKNDKEYTEVFEFLWDIYEKVGNKKLSFSKWKLLTSIQQENVKDKVRGYISNTNTDGTFPSRKHLQTFLNKKFEYWNDEIILESSGNKTKTASQVYDEMLGN